MTLFLLIRLRVSDRKFEREKCSLRRETVRNKRPVDATSDGASNVHCLSIDEQRLVRLVFSKYTAYILKVTIKNVFPVSPDIFPHLSKSLHKGLIDFLRFINLFVGKGKVYFVL